jgi:YD repeat-containing protein
VLLQRPKHACQATAIACGATSTGRLASPVALDAYTFAAAAGEVITIKAVGTGGKFQPELQLYDPDGRELQFKSVSGQRPLPKAGTYTIFVGSGSAKQAGSYEFTVQRTKDACQATTLPCGTSQMGTLASVTHLHAYTFPVTAGDTFLLRLTSTVETQMQLYDPDGLPAGVANSDADPLLPRLPTKTGTYTALVHASDARGNFTGHYHLMLQRTQKPCQPTPLTGCHLEAAITPQAQLGAFVFAGTSGQRAVLRLDSLTANFQPQMDVYDPDGRPLSAASGPGGRTAELRKTGAHTVIVHGGRRDTSFDAGHRQTGRYSIGVGNVAVTLLTPNGGEVLLAGSSVPLRWQSSSLTPQPGLASHELQLSTDSGVSYPITIASGLAPTLQSFHWDIPSHVHTTRGRLRVVARDMAGNVCQDDSNADIAILGLPPGQVMTYKYDALNRLVQVISGDGTTITYTYDAASNRLTQSVTHTPQ